MMRSAALLTLVFFAACSDAEKSANKPAPPHAATPAAPSEPAPNEPIAPRASAVGEEAFVTAVTGLRRLPSEDRQVEDPKAKGKTKKVSNWVATLHRGEQVEVVKVEEEWALVRASDESEGWVKKDMLLPTSGIAMATVFDEAKTFDRPDLLALNSKRKLQAGALLYVLKTRDQFSEVNHNAAQTAWVLRESLSTERREVEAAKLLNKARWLSTKDKDEAAKENAAAILELARTQFGDTKIVMAMDAALAEPPAQDAPAEARAPGAE